MKNNELKAAFRFSPSQSQATLIGQFALSEMNAEELGIWERTLDLFAAKGALKACLIGTRWIARFFDLGLIERKLDGLYHLTQAGEEAE